MPPIEFPLRKSERSRRGRVLVGNETHRDIPLIELVQHNIPGLQSVGTGESESLERRRIGRVVDVLLERVGS